MVTIGSVIYTLVSRFLLVCILLIFALPAFILIFVVPQRYRYNAAFFTMLHLFFKAVVTCTFLPIKIHGDRAVFANPSVVIANHSSSLDIPIVGMLLNGYPNVWLAMQWLTQFWTFKYILPRVAMIVDLASPQKSARSLIKIIRMIEERHMHVVIFPEGGRYTDGSVHDFYTGFVMLAKRTGYPVVPVKLINLQKVCPPDTFWLHYYPVHVVIGEPMYQMNDESDEQFKQRVHQWYTEQNY
jgi:1-acyl-sn-glycerol-3-phosphate acyltransferase